MRSKPLSYSPALPQHGAGGHAPERFTGGDAAREAQLVAAEPMGRMGTLEEVAEAVAWLCSDAAAFVTGTAMAVDGGFVAQ